MAGVEVTFCVVNTRAARAAACAASTRSRREREQLPFETEVLVLDNASSDGSAGAARGASGRRRGRSRSSSGAARPRTTRALLQRARGRYALLLNEDSELLPGRDRRAARGAARPTRAPARRARGCCAPTAASQPSRVALPDAGDRAGVGAAVVHRWTDRAEPRRAHARASTGRSRAALLVRRRGGARDRLVRPALLRLLRRGRLLQAPARRRLGDAVRPRGDGDPPRAALDRRRCPSGGSSSSRATATATCASTTRRGAAAARALADGLDLRAARRSRRSCCPATTRSATGATSPRRCVPERGEGLREAAAEYNRAAGGCRGARRASSRRRVGRSSRRTEAARRAAAAGIAGRAPARREPGQPAPSVGSSRSPATADAGDHGDRARRSGPTRTGTANRRRVSRCSDDEHRQVARRTARSPAPAMPERLDEHDAAATTLTTRPATAAGNVRVVTRARPAIVTKHEEEAVQRPAERDPGQRLVGVGRSRGGRQQVDDPAAEQRRSRRRRAP